MSDDDDAGVILPDEYLEEEDGPKRKGSIWKGIAFASLATVILELFVGLVMDAQSNLVHRYIAYMFGILTIFIASYYAKSTWKMFFLGTPVIVGVSFILPLALPDTFSGLMSPFINLLPTLLAIVESVEAIEGQDTSGLVEAAALIQTYGIVLDLVLAMFTGTFAALGLVGFVKIFSNKPGIFTIISFLFSLVFFIIGVIVLPYLLVVSSGISQFGLSLGAGALNLNQGFDIVNDGRPIAEASPFFDEAERWFAEADTMLEGLESMQVFTLLGTAAPDYETLINNFLILIDTAVNMAQSVVPMFLGISSLQTGFDKSLGILSGANQLAFSAINDQDLETFEDGIGDLKQGFGNISRAIPLIQEALSTLGDFDRDETIQAAKDQGVTDVGALEEQLDLIEGAVNLVNAALDVFKVLITDSDDTGPKEEPLVHLLRGALALSVNSDEIGTSTSFEGTDKVFTQVIGNLTEVVNSFENPAFDAFDNAVLFNVTALVEVRDQISGIFEFVEDSGNIAIAVGNFGITAGPALEGMNATISTIQNAADFSDITVGTYDDMITSFTEVNGTIEKAEQLRLDGINVNGNVTVMKTKAADEVYGLMSSGADEFVTLFEKFDLQTNGQNFFHLSHAFLNILITTREMTIIQGFIDNIQADFTVLEGLAFADIIQIQGIIESIDGNVTLIETSLDSVIPAIGQAAGNFSSLQNMDQMSESALAIDDSTPSNNATSNSILGNVEAIQGHIGDIRTETGTIPISQGELDTKVTNIGKSLEKIVIELGNVDNNLARVSISS